MGRQGVEIYFERVRPLEDLLPFISSFPTEIRQKIERFKSSQDRAARITAYAMLHETLMRCGRDLYDLVWDTKGRPTLTGKQQSIDFNIAHSGEYVVVAFSHHGRVGVDLERERELDVNAFRPRFNADQWHIVDASPDKRAAFFRLWASVEAVLKSEGLGIAGGISEVHLSRDISNASAEIAHYRGKRWYLSRPIVAPSYHCCIASEQLSEVIMKPFVAKGP